MRENIAEIAIVDDETTLTQSLEIQLKSKGHTPFLFHDGQSFMSYLEKNEPDVIFLDLKLPDTHGLEILSHIQLVNKEIPTIIITAHGNMDSAIRAMKIGAFDYLNKPFELSEIDIIINNALAKRRLADELALHRHKTYKKEGLSSIIGESSATKNIEEKIVKLGCVGATTVLIRGESGTGKELVAKGIHNNSIFSEEQFIDVNCATLPEHLLESELFGHEKGAFTDAKKKKIGLVEMADGGTIFLDEIGDIPLSLQSKLLRFLESKTFRRIGGNREIQFNGLIVAATNIDLERLVKEGSFREDLYYRLNVIPIVVPPLRDRGNDTILLAEYYLSHFARQFSKIELSLTSDVRECLKSYHWPGNVRELKNIMEMLAIMCDNDAIRLKDLPPQIVDPEKKGMAYDATETNGICLPCELRDSPLVDQLRFMEKRIINRALEKTNGVKTRAAIRLGISRYSLIRRLKALNKKSKL